MGWDALFCVLFWAAVGFLAGKALPRWHGMAAIIVLYAASLWAPPGVLRAKPMPALASVVLSQRGEHAYIVGTDTLMVNVRTLATFRDETRGLKDVLAELERCAAQHH
jgi:hypothetical protein